MPWRSNLRGGRGLLTTAARADGAALDLHGTFQQAAGNLREAEVRLGFRDLDLARVAGDSALTSRLGGRIEGWVRGPDLAATAFAAREGGTPPRGTRGSLRLALDPSRWRNRRFGSLEMNGDLRDDGVALNRAHRIGHRTRAAVVRRTAVLRHRAPCVSTRCNRRSRSRAAARATGPGKPVYAASWLSPPRAATRAGEPSTYAPDFDGSRVHEVTFDRSPDRSIVAAAL
jgi:hypothetical protein